MFSKINKISLKLTDYCNLNCEYCHLSTKEKETKNFFQDYENLRNFLKKLPLADRVEIRLIGGEISIFPSEIKRAIKEIRKLEQDIDVQFHFAYPTNGTCVDTILDLQDEIDPSRITISWDGINNSLSRKGYPDEYYLKELPRLANLPVSIVYCVTPNTVDYMYDSLDFLLKNNIKSFSFYFAHEGNYSDPAFVDKFRKQLQKINDRYVNDYNSGNKWHYANWQVIAAKSRHHVNTTKCRNMGRVLHVDINGDIYPCYYFGEHNAYQLGTITNGLSKEVVDKFNKEYFSLSCTCQNKQCFECPASNYIHSGGLLTRFKNLCHIRSIETEEYFKMFPKLNITPLDLKMNWFDDSEIEDKFLNNYNLPLGNPILNKKVFKSEKLEVLKNWHGKDS